MDLAKILADHRLWIEGKGGTRADLAGAYLVGAYLVGANLVGANLYGAYLVGAYLVGANLTGANLTGANLVGANLTGANLTRANLTGANLTGADSITWGQIGPVGQGRRLLTAWAHSSLPEPVIAGGCFRGTFADFRAKIAGCPWDWSLGSDADRERWRTECSTAADLLEMAVA